MDWKEGVLILLPFCFPRGMIFTYHPSQNGVAPGTCGGALSGGGPEVGSTEQFQGDPLRHQGPDHGVTHSLAHA